jgi:hemerythrin
MPITWDEKTMSTGVPTIDAQHQELFRRFNAFHAALLRGQASAELSSIVEFFRGTRSRTSAAKRR